MSKFRLWVTAFFFRRTRPSMPGSIPSKPTGSPSKPALNNLYSYDARKSLWCPTTESSAASASSLVYPPNTPFFSLISWNVDFAAPLVVRRFQTSLSHLEQLIGSPSSPPTIVLLQEVDSSCFKSLLSDTFLREFYQVTNISSPQSYSTITLVPHSLAHLVSSVSRTPFAETRMQRDCLCVELDVPVSGAPAPKTLRIRIANTHLESLNGFGDRARPKQLGVISKLLGASGVDGGLVAGDMNCISSSDQDLPEQLGLSDAWIAVKNTETGVDEPGAEEGHTWGYQPSCKYPPRRLDKILTVGKLKATELQRIGVGLTIEGSDTWVSDHYGLRATISLLS